MKEKIKVNIKNILKHKKILVLALLFIISIGYAIIQTSFGFDGLALLTGRINIYFDNLVVSDGSVTANTPASIVGDKKLKINFDITLSDPKDYYEFEVDIVNDSNHDGRISKVIKSNIQPELDDYIIYTIKYIDNGKDVLYGDTILKNNKRRIKFRVEFKDNINLFSILNNSTPSDPLSLNMSYELTFIDDEHFSPCKEVDILGNKVKACIDNGQSEFVTSTNGIDYSKAVSDTNGKGLYLRTGTENDTNPIFFYRGAVEDNNVIFADKCWKILRTTENGGTKLIYNGLPSDAGTCDNTGDASQINKSSFNNKNPKDTVINAGYMYGDTAYYSDNKPKGELQNQELILGNDVTYNNGKYTLVDTYTKPIGEHLSSANVGKRHYTCLNTDTSCEKVAYVIYYSETFSSTYITLSSGKKILDILDEMLPSNNDLRNANDSTMKSILDDWYTSSDGLVGYDEYLDDAVWCNDRSIGTLSSFDKDTRLSISSLNFSGKTRNFYTRNPNPALKDELACPNKLDRFAVNDTTGNGKLSYKIGLLTADELVASGFGVESFIFTGNTIWTMTPAMYIGDYVENVYYLSNGNIGTNSSGNSAEYGVRPSVVLKSGTTSTSGDGTANDPYIITSTSSCKKVTLLGNKVEACPDNESSTYVTSESGINYKAVSSDTNGKGLYLYSSTKNDENPIYFYRGEVDNNNVLFANKCWQIVRTTETGGTKLIYNGLPDSNGKCVRDDSLNGSDRQLTDTIAYGTGMDSPANAGYMVGTIYNYKSKDMTSTTYQYGNSVTYNSGTYTLTDAKEIAWSEDISNNHYTCFTTGTTCSTVYYIYYGKDNTAHYIELINGKKVEDALDEMLLQNNTDSNVKDYIENTWFASTMLNYDDYLEDTVWCADLSISRYSGYAGWNPNGGDIKEDGLLFTPNNDSTFECKNPSDRFTVSADNGNGLSKYKVGMITRHEAEIAGLRSGFSEHPSYLTTGSSYWMLSPSNFRNSWARALTVSEDGGIYGSAVLATDGIRPMISLKKGIVASSGDGTAANPYVIS